MAGDEGTLATTAQVLLAIGVDASAAQILEANTNIWIKYAEAEIYLESGKDFVTGYSDVTALLKQTLAVWAADRAAYHAINQDQNSWGLSTTQSKLNILLGKWKAALIHLKDADKLELILPA